MMNTMTLYMKAQVLRASGAHMTAGDVAAPVNALGTTIWENVDVGDEPDEILGADIINGDIFAPLGSHE